MQIPVALIRASAAALACCLAAPALALAADGEQTPLNLDGSGDKAAETVGTSGGTIVRTIVGLAVVIGVIYGLTWVLKQVKASRQQAAGGGGLTALATLPLGANRALHLVRAGDEIVLVGSGEHGVTPIRTYTEAEARALGLLDDDDDPPKSGGGDVFAAGPRNLIDRLREKTVIR